MKLAGLAILELASCCAFVLVGCAAGPARTEAEVFARHAVLQRLDDYMVASRAVDADAIAAFYSTTGTLFEPGIEPIVSADAIRSFIRSFPGAMVEVANVTPDEVEVFGATVVIWGSYHERLSFPGQPVSEQDGKFVMEWKKDPYGVWLVERLLRVPLPPKTP